MVERIKDLTKSGWQWKIKRTDYRTNGNGEGLWVYVKSGAVRFGHSDSPKVVKQWKQVGGTATFSIPEEKRKAYNKLYYQFVTSTPENWND